MDRADLESQLEQQRNAAIALQAQRSLLGDEIVSAALASINQHIESLTAQLAAFDSNTITPPLDDAGHDERRLVTILFAALQETPKESSQRKRIDPEELHDLMQMVWGRLVEVVQSYGGVTDLHVGENLMAVFGAPTAREDDAVRALECGLALQDEIRSLRAQTAQPLYLQTGVHTGPVVVSQSAHGTMRFLGDTVNVANRMQKAAPLGRLLISEQTERAIHGRFETEALGPIRVKGKTEPICVFLVQVARPLAERWERRGFGLPRTPTIGRTTELTQLAHTFETAVQSAYQRALILMGDAGLGKSRLISDFCDWVATYNTPPEVYIGRALPDSINTPFFPWRLLWSSQFQLPDNAPFEQVFDRFSEKAEGLWDDPAVPWSEVADVLAYMMGMGRADSPHIAPLRRDGRLVRGRGFVLVRALLQRLARRHGSLVVIIEDLHWADTASLDLIEYLLNSHPSTFPLFLIATARPDFAERKPNWHALANLVYLPLAPLSHEEAFQLVSTLLPETLSATLYEQVVAQADGNPYYLEELARLILDQVQTSGESLPERQTPTLPDSLRRLLQARLDALPPEARRVAQHAAVVGRVFWAGAIKATDARLPVTSALELLEQREIIYRRHESAIHGQPEYFFKHALLRDVAYEMLALRERRHCHAIIAHWLENQRDGKSEMAATIAGHYANAGRTEQARHAYHQAATSAAARGALPEALTLVQAALSLEPPPQERFELLLTYEHLLDLQGDRERQKAVLEEALALAERLQTPEAIAEIYIHHAHYFGAIGDSAAMIIAAQRAIGYAYQTNKADLEITGTVLWADGLTRRGDVRTARNRYQEALTLAESTDNLHGQARSFVGLGQIAALVGDDAGARWFVESALRLYRQMDDRGGEVEALQTLAELWVRRGDFEAALSSLTRAEQVAESLGDRRAHAHVLARRADLLSQQGEHQLAFALYRESLATLHSIEDRLGEANVLLQMGRAHLRRYEWDPGLTLFRRVRMMARRLADVRCEALALREMGDVFAALGDYLHAQAAYSNCIALAKEIGDPLLILDTQFQMALIHHWRGHSDASEWEQAIMLLKNIEQEAKERHLPVPEAQAKMALGMVAQAAADYRTAIPHLRSAADILLDASQGALGANALAILALAYLDANLPEEANETIEQALTTLETIPMGFHTMPRQIVWASAIQIARAWGRQASAEALLDQAHQFIRRQADSIEDEGLRRSFLENVPYNRTILDEREPLKRRKKKKHRRY